MHLPPHAIYVSQIIISLVFPFIHASSAHKGKYLILCHSNVVLSVQKIVNHAGPCLNVHNAKMVIQSLQIKPV